jgi:Raf kinase inhibitor-like YbhB/YbcL family protein
MKITSPVFSNQGSIPANHTCEGANTSPALSWTEVPRTAKSLALVVDDPDAPVGTWVHWLAYNIPIDAKTLPAGVPPMENLPHGILQGKNSFNKTGYGGPCPPPGHGVHRYFFRLYALDKLLEIPAGASRKELDDAMRGHIVSRAELMGRFERQLSRKKTEIS